MLNVTKQKLKELLVEPGHVSEADFGRAALEAEKERRDLAGVLVEKEFIKDEQLGQLIAQDRGVPFIDLRNEKIDSAVLAMIPDTVARARGVIAFARDGDRVKVAMTDPGDMETKQILAKRFGFNFEPYLITENGWRAALEYYHPGLAEELGEMLGKVRDASLPREERDKIIIDMVDAVLRGGQRDRASDIHIEPLSDHVAIRYRIDGILHTVAELPPELLDIILSRVKILARMRTDEHRAAQDGKFQFRHENETVDIRVSIVPVTKGENAVLRLLSAGARQMRLDALGFSGADLKRVEAAVKNPHGMIIVAGPTGSGKTTTLYEIVKKLNTDEVHISSIEDPVEYDIEGVSQIQVDPKTNLTFAKGLRAIVRQDPDVILVGEIRDKETAGIAVNSAMTGHLVLSTLHANDAATALLRLLEMGIEPFLVASTVRVIIAQRLVRTICPKCRRSYPLGEEEKTLIAGHAELRKIIETGYKKDMDKIIFYKGDGCGVCARTGYSGRIGIFEVMELGQTVKSLLVKRAPSGEIMAAARAGGMTTVMEDGVAKIFDGTTTLSEVLRVTME